MTKGKITIKKFKASKTGTLVENRGLLDIVIGDHVFNYVLIDDDSLKTLYLQRQYLAQKLKKLNKLIIKTEKIKKLRV